MWLFDDPAVTLFHDLAVQLDRPTEGSTDLAVADSSGSAISGGHAPSRGWEADGFHSLLASSILTPDFHVAPGQFDRPSEPMTRLAMRLFGEADAFIYDTTAADDGAPTKDASTFESSTEPDGGEIVVIGYRPQYGTGGYGGGSFNGTDPDASIDGPGGETGEQEPPPDCAATTADPDPFVELDEAEKGNLDTIGDTADDLIEWIGGLPANGKFVSTTGETIYVSELYSLLVLADWRISNVPQNNAPTPDLSMGAALRGGGNPTFVLSEEGLRAHGSDSFNARAYILHELAHVTEIGSGRNGDAQADGNWTDSEWRTNEQWANALAAAVASAIDQPLSNWPGLGGSAVGFGSQTFTYVPPADGNSQTAAEDYQGCGGTA